MRSTNEHSKNVTTMHLSDGSELPLIFLSGAKSHFDEFMHNRDDAVYFCNSLPWFMHEVCSYDSVSCDGRRKYILDICTNVK